jgi:ATP-dependent Clp protease protease subunit
MAAAEKEKLSLEQRFDEWLMKKRRVFLSRQVDDQSSKDIINRLWMLGDEDPEKPILFVINSPGGSVDHGMAIWDAVKMVPCPVYTLVTGIAASMGSILSLSAPKGKRFATKNARVMIHQPLIGGVIQGQATDLEIHAKEIIKTRKLLVEIYVEATGKEHKVIDKALDRDTWMTAQEAKEYGLIDQIITSYKEFD